MPYDVKIRENAARTLEYAYDDFTIYQLAKALYRSREEQKLYARRSQNYRNLFDPETKLALYDVSDVVLPMFFRDFVPQNDNDR